MREQLIHYVDLLFAGNAGAGEIKQEILQNTLDRYDDLVSQGKSPEAAYSLAISGIGDINEILCSGGFPSPEAATVGNREETPMWKRILRAIAVFFYIISIIPLIVLGELGMDTLGLCGFLVIAGLATVLVVIAGGKITIRKWGDQELTPIQERMRTVHIIVTAVGLVVYTVLSVLTGAWHMTWLVFLIMAAVCGLIKACIDLKEANKL